MKRKFVPVVLAAVMAFNMAACGGSGEPATPETPETPAPAVEDPGTTETPETPEEPEEPAGRKFNGSSSGLYLDFGK